MASRSEDLAVTSHATISCFQGSMAEILKDGASLPTPFPSAVILRGRVEESVGVDVITLQRVLQAITAWGPRIAEYPATSGTVSNNKLSLF